MTTWFFLLGIPLAAFGLFAAVRPSAAAKAKHPQNFTGMNRNACIFYDTVFALDMICL